MVGSAWATTMRGSRPLPIHAAGAAQSTAANAPQRSSPLIGRHRARPQRHMAVAGIVGMPATA
eukprot:12398312-Alexandrium_andersonii.AAC.1